MERDTGADPCFIDVEIDAHHFALTHPDKIVDERGIRICLRPNKHHPNLGLRFLTIDRRHERRIIDFSLQNPFVRILQGGDFLVGRFHIYAVACE